MEFYKSVFRTLALVFTLQLSFTSCTPREQILELTLEKQAIEQPFTLAEYCKDEYDSIYIIFPHDNPETIQKLPYKMSRRLRNYCSCTSSDSYSTILFINKGTIEAYSEITCDKVIFSPPYLSENAHSFPFKQQFILNNERVANLYK